MHWDDGRDLFERDPFAVRFEVPHCGKVLLHQGAHAGRTKSYKVLYLFFQLCKALQSLIFGVFPSKMSYKVLFLLEKKVSEVRNVYPTLK